MADSLNDYIEAYKVQLALGNIQKAYQGLMTYIMGLRNYLSHKYGDEFYIGNISSGHLDFSYFPFTSRALRSKKLKILIMFDHPNTRFEIWLAGQNRKIQQQYWEQLQDQEWGPYHVPPKPLTGFSIIEGILAENPDFEKQDALTRQIEQGVLRFTQDISAILT